MRFAVLGGSGFLSGATALSAVARGHEVTCMNRGESGVVPDGAAWVRWDRHDPVPDQVRTQRFDAVVDVAGRPSWVRTAVQAWPSAHWVFISTVNVYADDSSPGGGPGRTPLQPPLDPEPGVIGDSRETYGPMKVACEQIVRAGAVSATVIRPGLIVGPGDPTGRFSYWPARLVAAGEVLAGGSAHDLAQVIDVRDLASWIVTCAERRTVGDFDGVGSVLPLADLLGQVAAGVGSAASVTWVPQDFLLSQGVTPWDGPNAIPLWVPRPDYDGFMSHDPTPAITNGLTLRPLADTARDTLAWMRAHPDVPVSGLSREREAQVLAAWHARTG